MDGGQYAGISQICSINLKATQQSVKTLRVVPNRPRVLGVLFVAIRSPYKLFHQHES